MKHSAGEVSPETLLGRGLERDYVKDADGCWGARVVRFAEQPVAPG